MYKLDIHESAVSDLKELMVKDADAASKIVALLEQIKADQYLLDSLTVHNFGEDHSEDFHVSKYYEFWNRNIDIWRLKIWKVQKYRIIYAYHRGHGAYYILAIAPRSFNYDKEHPITKRIISQYSELGLD